MIQRCRVAIRNAVTLVAVAALAMLSLVLVTPSAQAHDAVIKSVPADGSHVETFPKVIDMTFSGVPKPNFNTVAITHEQSGKLIYSGEPELDGQQVKVQIPEGTETPDGTYIVGFQITSSDGHATRGKISFTVGDDVAGTSTETDTPAAEEKSNNLPLIAGGGVGLLVVAAGAIYLLSRKEKSDD